MSSASLSSRICTILRPKLIGSRFHLTAGSLAHIFEVMAAKYSVYGSTGLEGTLV